MFVFYELAYDTLIFGLTIARTVYVLSQQGPISSAIRRRSLWKGLVANGAMYYGVIFSTNLSWAVMILHAPTGLRAMSAM